MSSRRAVVKRITDAAKRRDIKFKWDKEGGNHTHYLLDGLLIPIPRHRTIDEYLVLKIYKECEPKLGERWWRK